MESQPTVDKIVKELGGCGRMQMLLAVAGHALKLPVVFSMYLTFFSVADPSWRCAEPVHESPWNSHNDTENYSNALGYYKSSIPESASQVYNVSNVGYRTSLAFSENATSGNKMNIMSFSGLKSCTNQNGSRCKSFVFDSDLHTIVSEWSITCDLGWIPSFIASMQMAGLFAGNLLCGQLADIVGRKPPMFGSLLLLIIANLMAYFAQSWIVFGVARIFCGLAMGAFLTVQYSISTEVMPSKWRAWLIQFPSWSIIACVFCLVSYVMPDWRKLHLLVSIVTVPFLFLWWFIPESFRWFISHERTTDAHRVIRYIAKVNRKLIKDDSLLHMLKNDQGELTSGDKRKYTFIHLLKTRQLVKTTLLSALNWLALGMLSYGIQFGIQALSGNIFLNWFIFSVIGIPVSFGAIILTNVIGRRYTVVLTYVIATVGCVVVGIVQFIDTEHRGALTNGFALFASLGIGLAWGPVQVMTLELYPTVIRNIGYGFLNTFARIGAILGPQLAYLDQRVPGVMYFVCAAVSCCCILGTLALSETKGTELQDKIEMTIVRSDRAVNGVTRSDDHL